MVRLVTVEASVIRVVTLPPATLAYYLASVNDPVAAKSRDD
jgi:hypothetical protein